MKQKVDISNFIRVRETEKQAAQQPAGLSSSLISWYRDEKRSEMCDNQQNRNMPGCENRESWREERKPGGFNKEMGRGRMTQRRETRWVDVCVTSAVEEDHLTAIRHLLNDNLPSPLMRLLYSLFVLLFFYFRRMKNESEKSIFLSLMLTKQIISSP